MKLTPSLSGAGAIFLALATLISATPQSLAAGKVSTADLSPMNGVWKTEFTNASGQALISYSVYRVQDNLGLQAVSSFTVDRQSKKVETSFFGYVGVDPATNQFIGFYFSTDGWVASSVMVPTARGRVYQVHVTASNNVQVAGTLIEQQESPSAMTIGWKNMLSQGKHVEQSPPDRYVKTDQTMRELRESGAVVFPSESEPLPALAPLKRLIGRWEGKDASGTLYNLAWSWRGSGKWLVERWRIADTMSGINVTGINPATGQLAMWSIVPSDAGLSGTWHIMGDNTLGQTQGESRIVREFTSADTFTARWQAPKAGGFVDGSAAEYGPPYTATRVSGRE